MSKTLLSLLTTGAVAASLFAAVAAAAIPVNQRSTLHSSSTLAGLEARVLVVLNRIRTRHGLIPLHASAGLQASSLRHSREMGALGYFAHTSPTGTTLWQRVAQSYPAGRRESISVGENLFWSSPTVGAARVARLWMSSPEHRANMLAPNWREIGIGAVRFASAPGVFGGSTVTIITTDFGVSR
jgi:uncharacterized protein YkwD